MRREREGSTLVLIAAMLIGSGIFHLILWPLGDRVLKWQWPASELPNSDGFMEVTLLEPPEDAVDPEVQQLLDGQGKLVQQHRKVNETRPDNTQNLSEFDQKVERETRAPNRRKRPGDAPQRPGQDADGQQMSPQPGKALHPSPARDPSQSRGEVDDGNGAQPIDADSAREGSLPQKPGASGGNLRGLRGTTQDMHRVFGTPGSFDDLQEVEEGQENILSSRRWKYASFFNRVRDAIAQHWDPVSIHNARDPTGSKWGTATRFTRLAITLNPEGALLRVRVHKPCGVPALDEEAIRAVRSAAPFINPPRQLVDANSGNIEFLFGFIFEINGKPRIFRIQR